MRLGELVVFLAFLAATAAAIWLLSRRPLFERVTAFLGTLVVLLGAIVAVRTDTQVSRKWAMIVIVAGLGLFAWGIVRAFRTKKPLGSVGEYRPTPEQRQRNRRTVLELVKNTWIKGMSEQSPHGVAMIELGLEERIHLVEHPWDIALQTPDQPRRLLPRGTKIVDIFNEVNRALLILGEPGSGKTTTLLELARDVIACAERDSAEPIPVVFKLSSWSDPKQSIVAWLVEELNTKYYIPKRIAHSWVENDELLLLLDGLDEVKMEHQEACIQAINDFRLEHLVPLVVCSRVADYEVLTVRLKLEGAILLQPLTPQQVDEYLQGDAVELLAVRRTIECDTALQELAQSPLMLSIMTLAYQGMSYKELQPLDSVDARRRQVFDAYVRRMLERPRVDQSYSSEQTLRWLAWLAQRMSQHAQTIFLLERIEPSWLRTGDQRRSYLVALSSFIFWLTIALFVALVGGLPLGLGLWLERGWAGGLVVGVLGAEFFFWMITWAFRYHLTRPAEVLEWSWKGIGKGLLQGLVPVLVVGISALCFTTINVPQTMTREDMDRLTKFAEQLDLEPLDQPLDQLTPDPIDCLYPLLFVGLGFMLQLGLYEGLRTMEMETTTTPNQGIRQSARNAVVIGVVCGVVFGLSTWLFIGLPELLMGNPISLLVGLFLFGIIGSQLGLTYGGGHVIRHLCLRATLCFTGHMPWDYTRFLDYATDRIFLRKVGGGYIFIHRLLQDYFASLYQDQ